MKNCEIEPTDSELAEALKQFRVNAHAWSAQEYAKSSNTSSVMIRRTRRWPFRLALVACLAVIATSIPVHREEMRRAREVKAAMDAQADVQLMKDVDSEVSQRVPKSMSPLTYLIASEEPGSEQIDRRNTRQGEREP